MGDQPEAILGLVDGIRSGKKHQVLLGATGTGKTFTIASVIQQVQKPALIMAHNKTLAAQLYAEFKEPLYAPPPLLLRMVDAGHLGRKTGRGFYDYEPA